MARQLKSFNGDVCVLSSGAYADPRQLPSPTTCVTAATPPASKFASGDNLYVFDCGTGLRALGQQLQRDSEGKPVRAHIFVSHFHWDHIQGIPFFGPLYENPENCFSFHSSSRSRTLKRVMEEQMAAPYFPVDMSGDESRSAASTTWNRDECHSKM